MKHKSHCYWEHKSPLECVVLNTEGCPPGCSACCSDLNTMFSLLRDCQETVIARGAGPICPFVLCIPKE